MRLGSFEVWDDVMDETLDEEIAPEIYKVVSGDAHSVYLDSREFFRRTYFSESMLNVLEKLLDTFEGKEKRNVFLIYSLFGGGKTHTLLTVYHALKNPEALVDPDVLEGQRLDARERLKRISERLMKLEGVKVLVIHGQRELGQPSAPLEVGPYEVKTLWGYVAHSLGKYALVEKYDQSLTVPPIETLAKLFEGEKVLLLVDEIAHYVQSLSKSANQDDRNYAENVPNFLHSLAKALTVTSSVMIMTLPVEKSPTEMGEEVGNVEVLYDPKIVKAIWAAISKLAGSDLYSPLRTSGVSNELVEVLKKRIFKSINEDERAKVLRRIRTEISNTDVFGRASNFEEELRKTYPFHPEYVDVLRTIIERTGLQRTRDMLRITRMVVRELAMNYSETGFAPSMIMPYHINLKDEKIRGMLFGKSEIFMDYGTIVDEDLKSNKFKDFQNRELLAEIILKYVFLRTYPFDSPVPLPGFPTAESIARGVYEPNLFDAERWLPTDIKETVKEILASSHFIYLNKKEGILWFWRVANVSQMIESEMRDLLDNRIGEVWNELVKYATRMIKERKRLTTRGRGSKIEDLTTFFKENYILVTKDPQEFHDTPDYKLQVLVRDDIDERMLKKIIYFYGTGTRTYRNTIVVCYPVKGSFDHLIETTARVMACDNVLNKIKAKYGKFGEDVVKIQMQMVNDIRSKSLEDLESEIVSSFRKVAYPENDEVSIVTAQSTSKSVVENVYSALMGSGKIVDEFNFDWLVDRLKDVGIRILRPEGYPVSEIVSIIRMNTRLPMIENSYLTDAIRRAILDLKIGLERNGEVFFKKVYKEIPNVEEEGNPPTPVKLRDLVLPREIALHRQVCNLLKNEKEATVFREDGDYLIRTWYEVYPPSSSVGIPLRSIVEEENGECRVKDEFVDAVLQGYIVEKEEIIPVEGGEFKLIVDPPQVKAKPGTAVEVKVQVKPVGSDSFDVELSVSRGELDSYEVHLENGKATEVTWTIIMPDKRTVATIKGESYKRKRYADVILIPQLGECIIETDTLKEEHKGMFLTSILEIEDLDTLDMIPENIKGTLSGSMRIEKPLWEGRFEGIDREILSHILKEIQEFLGGKATLSSNFHIVEKVKLDDLLFEKLKPLNGKVTFRLEKEEC